MATKSNHLLSLQYLLISCLALLLQVFLEREKKIDEVLSFLSFVVK